MSLKLFEDTRTLTAFVVPLGAIVGAAVDKMLGRFTLTTFEPGKGLWATVIEPVHLDDVVAMIVFGVLAFAGYRAKHTILLLFGLGGLAGVVANEVKEAIDFYMPM